jgi:hypothetical protein
MPDINALRVQGERELAGYGEAIAAAILVIANMGFT